MKKLVFTLLLMFPIVCQAQTEESKYYIYNIVSFVGDFTKENFKVFYDDEVSIEYRPHFRQGNWPSVGFGYDWGNVYSTGIEKQLCRCALLPISVHGRNSIVLLPLRQRTTISLALTDFRHLNAGLRQSRGHQILCLRDIHGKVLAGINIIKEVWRIARICGWSP